MDLLTKSETGSEDCLYLNVYSPNLKPDKPLPVMFWIHGGGLTFGSGEDDFYGPEFLIRQGVILVTINYRLEVLGFLYLDTEDVPGNAGLKDQVEALRWVNKNISNFGGDPNNVTIFGESAGSASVTYHLVSPMTKGLFKRAIAQSGACYCSWARVYKPRERALALARQLGFYSENDKELYDFFTNQSPQSFVARSVPVLLSEKSFSGVAYFSVVDEKNIDNNERFFSNEFVVIHEDVEIMIGYTTDEGLVFMAQGDTPKAKLEMARDFPEFFVPKFLAVDLTVNQQLEVGKKIKKFYFKDKIDISEDWEQLANFYAAANLVYDIHHFTKVCAKSNKVYLYSFSCKSEINIFSNLLGVKDIIQNKPVTCHGDDLFYLFHFKALPDKIDSSSQTFQLVDKVTKLWTNFAKYGNPTPDESLGVKWEHYTVEKENYLDIGNEFVANTALDAEDVKFWGNIYEEYAQKLE